MFPGSIAIFFPASKCPKTLKIVKVHKKDVKTGSTLVFWVQNHDFWLRNLGSKGDLQDFRGVLGEKKRSR